MTQGRKAKATLESVALQANVSKITVSRAFSHPDKVHPETLKRVLHTAREMGYVVNTAARNLRARDSKTIGIINPDMNNPFFGGLTRLMTQEAEKAGYDTLVFDSRESQELESRIVDKLIGYNVDAIVMSVISSDQNYHPGWLQRLQALNIPLILVDRELDTPACSGVYIDNLDCGLQAGRYLLEQQLARVVVVSGPQDSNVARERVTGLGAALTGKVASFDILYADFYMDIAARVAGEYLDQHTPPDVFVGCNNQISLGIIKSCIDRGLQPMRDIALFSIDELYDAAIYGFHVPCIAHDLSEIAWQAINLAIRQATDSTSKPGKVIVRGQLIPPTVTARSQP